MESELLKEPWAFPATKTRPTSSPAGPENSAFSAWEENFQDLSGWCMDLPMTWNRQYDFPIGELIPPKLSDAKNKDDKVSTTERGESKGLTGIGQEKLGTLGSTLGSHTLVAGQLQAGPQPVQQYQQQLMQLEQQQQQQYPQQKHEVRYNIIDDSSDVWLNSPMAAEKTSTLAYKIIGTNDESGWSSNIEKNDVASRHEDLINTTSEDGCIVPFDTTEDQREASVDFLHQLGVSELATFDLLSYVCDDRTNSTEGSVMSARSTCESPNAAGRETARAQGERKSKRVLRRPKASTPQEEALSPALPSTSRSDPSSKIAEEVSRPSRPRERRQSSVSSKSSSRKSTQSRRGGTKRFLDSDSEDQSPSPHNYRESRERNNEASRKSRMNKKVKETEMSRQAAELERDNRILRMKVEELEKLVTAMRTALLRSALKKEP